MPPRGPWLLCLLKLNKAQHNHSNITDCAESHDSETACSASGLGARGLWWRPGRGKPDLFIILSHQSGRCKTSRTRQNWPFGLMTSGAPAKTDTAQGSMQEKGPVCFGRGGGVSLSCWWWIIELNSMIHQVNYEPITVWPVGLHGQTDQNTSLWNAAFFWIVQAGTEWAAAGRPETIADKKGRESFISIITRSEPLCCE